MLTSGGQIKCDICGKFIATDELIEQTATHCLLMPESDLTVEDYESYHNACFAKEQRKRKE